jgi:hypothetical protein
MIQTASAGICLCIAACSFGSLIMALFIISAFVVGVILFVAIYIAAMNKHLHGNNSSRTRA